MITVNGYKFAETEKEFIEALSARDRPCRERQRRRSPRPGPTADAAPAGPHEVDVAGFVPDDIFTPQILHQHQHEKRIGHGIQAAAEMGSDIVAVVPPQREAHLDFSEVRADAPDPDSGGCLE